MFKGGKNTTGDIGEDDVFIAAFQSLATLNITCEINPDSFLCQKQKNKNKYNSESQTSDQGDREINISSAQPETNKSPGLRGGWYNHQYED